MSKHVIFQFLDEVIEVEVINKRVIGRVMIKYCGHEGTANDKRTASLRKLLQAVIDCLQSSHKHTNWRNAEVTVYDLDDNSFRIISGQGKHQFVVSDVGNGEPEIVNTSNKVTKTRQVRVPQRSEHQQDIRPSSRTHGRGEQQWDSRPSSKTHAGFESTHPYRYTTHDVNSGHHYRHKTDEEKHCIIS